jgi:hypothetical protein
MRGVDPVRAALRDFAELVAPAREDATIDLTAAALAIARTEYPDLDVPHYLARLDEMAQRVSGRMRKNPTARESIALLNQVLFQEEACAAIVTTSTIRAIRSSTKCSIASSAFPLRCRLSIWM